MFLHILRQLIFYLLSLINHHTFSARRINQVMRTWTCSEHFIAIIDFFTNNCFTTIVRKEPETISYLFSTQYIVQKATSYISQMVQTDTFSAISSALRVRLLPTLLVGKSVLHLFSR